MGKAGEVEVELKLLLEGGAALERVADALVARGARRSAPVRQVNHFFDSQGADLRAAGTTLRLREEAGRFACTAKGPSFVEGDVHRRDELELELAPGAAGDVLAGRVDPLAHLERRFGAEHPLLVAARAALAGRELVEVGCFENERTRVGPLAVGPAELDFELDRTRLPGDRLDHELELEFPAGLEREAERLVAEVLREAGAAGTPARSKAARFFDSLAS